MVVTHQGLPLFDTVELPPIGAPALCSGHGKALQGYPRLVWKRAVPDTRQTGQDCVVVEAVSRLHPSPGTHGAVDEAVLEGSIFHPFARGAA